MLDAVLAVAGLVLSDIAIGIYRFGRLEQRVRDLDRKGCAGCLLLAQRVAYLEGRWDIKKPAPEG